MKHENYMIYLFGLVAIVAIVSLVLSEGGLEGAQTADFEVECVDTDSLNDRYVAGTSSLGTLEYHDYCRNGVVYQFHCGTSQQVRTMRGFECANGCLNGACLN